MVGLKGEEMSSLESNKMKTVAAITITIAVILMFAVLFVKMFIGDSSYKTTDEKSSSVEVLSCTSNVKVNSFFDTNLADKVNHKIKVTFNNSVPAEISYNLLAEYSNKESFDKEGRV